MNQARHKQNGATLIVGLIMLVMLTLFVIAMINGSNISLRIASNFQSQKVLEQGANQELENFISNSSNFSISTPAQTPVCVNGVGASCVGGYHVIVGAPICLRGVPATGYSKKVGELAPDDVDWEIQASVVDPVTDDLTKPYMRIIEGVRVRMLAGACP